MTDADGGAQALRGATVINCAAFTDVDGAESDPAAAHAANAEGARNVAEAAERVVYVSTDYVFDGTKKTPYVESDPVEPLQEYGRSKLAGERATAEANPNHLIVRSSWLFGARRRNFVETMLALGRERDELRVVDDQVGCPDLHRAPGRARSWSLAASADQCGVLHVAGAGSCSWFEFARQIFARADVDCGVQPCTTEDFPRPARRPAYSVLGSERGARTLPAVAGRPRGVPGGAGVRLLVTGGAGFIGSTYARLFGGRARRGRARQAHLRRPPRERPGRASSWWWAASRTASS